MKIALNIRDRRITEKQAVLSFYFSLAILLALFLFSAWMGIIDYNATEHKMKEQIFPDAIAVFLTRLNIGLQILTVGGLIYMIVADNPKIYGLILPVVMLGTYTLYSLLAAIGAFGFEPCTCINLFEGTTWLEGSLINMAFLGISIISVLIFKRKGGAFQERK